MKGGGARGKGGRGISKDGEKQKYSDMAAEEGWADTELIASIEREIVEQVNALFIWYSVDKLWLFRV